MSYLMKEEPIVNYNFLVRVNENYDIPCKSVQGLQEEYEYEYIQEGGVNDYVHIRRKPVQKPGTFQVECYAVNVDRNPLAVGACFDNPIQLLVARYPGEFTASGITFTFRGCTVISKQYGQLSSEQSGILTEIITIAYQEMKCSGRD